MLTIVDAETGFVSAAQLVKKGDGPYAVHFVSTFLDQMRAENVRVRYANEVSLVCLVEKVKAFRHPRVTTLEPIVRAEHAAVGAVERAHRSVQGATRSLVLDVRARTGLNVQPVHCLFAYMVRHSSWASSRFQPRGPRDITAFENRNGYSYKSPLVPFGEIVMVRVPIDPPGLRKKLDTQWIKGVWVGRMDENDGNIILTEHGAVVGKSVRRLAVELRYQKSVIDGLKCKISHQVLSQPALLGILQLGIPVRLEGETEMMPPMEGDVGQPSTDEIVVDDAQAGVEEVDTMHVEDVFGTEDLGDAMAMDETTSASSRKLQILLWNLLRVGSGLRAFTWLVLQGCRRHLRARTRALCNHAGITSSIFSMSKQSRTGMCRSR